MEVNTNGFFLYQYFLFFGNKKFLMIKQPVNKNFKPPIKAIDVSNETYPHAHIISVKNKKGDKERNRWARVKKNLLFVRYSIEEMEDNKSQLNIIKKSDFEDVKLTEDKDEYGEKIEEAAFEDNYNKQDDLKVPLIPSLKFNNQAVATAASGWCCKCCAESSEDEEADAEDD